MLCSLCAPAIPRTALAQEIGIRLVNAAARRPTQPAEPAFPLEVLT
jgi:hypothetical protein